MTDKHEGQPVHIEQVSDERREAEFVYAKSKLKWIFVRGNLVTLLFSIAQMPNREVWKKDLLGMAYRIELLVVTPLL